MTPGEGEHALGELDWADRALGEGRHLLAGGFGAGAATRLYYAVFHASRAALAVRGLYSKTHSGLVTLYERTFGATPLLGRLLELRGKADYEIEDFRDPEEGFEALSEQVGAFVASCRVIVEEAIARGPDEPDPPPDY